MSQLIIQDESAAVIKRAMKKQNKHFSPADAFPTPAMTPQANHSDSSSSSGGTIELDMLDFSFNGDNQLNLASLPYENLDMQDAFMFDTYLPITLTPNADDLATSVFFKEFSAVGQWQFLEKYRLSFTGLNPALALAVEACGMAILDNQNHIPMGREWSRSKYGEALRLTNEALRDPMMATKDESLMAVNLLSYYENITCDSPQSIASWKAHIKGLTQLLKMRGDDQFKSQVGKVLFRDMLSQIMINCIWSDEAVPDFIVQGIERLSGETIFVEILPADKLLKISVAYAGLRAHVHNQTIDDNVAAAQCAEIERKMIDWSAETMCSSDFWRWRDVQVDDNDNVWNGTLHEYKGRHPVPGVWNMYRCIRIMLSRTQQQCYGRLPLSKAARETHEKHFKSVRRQMTDEICHAVPWALGHATPKENNTKCVLISAYALTWPLFFAGTCVLERIHDTPWQNQNSEAGKLLEGYKATVPSAAATQAAWIVGRMDYISKNIGLHWASGIAQVLKGDFSMHADLLDLNDSYAAMHINRNRMLGEPIGEPLVGSWPGLMLSRS